MDKHIEKEKNTHTDASVEGGATEEVGWYGALVHVWEDEFAEGYFGS
jgi:hypothetical protein